MSAKKLTVEELKDKFYQIHGSDYDYHLFIDYKSTHDKIKIICPIHGEFEQPIKVHLMGCKCRKCAYLKNGRNRRMTQAEFITRAKKVHGNNFDWDDVIYKTMRERIHIKCNLCGKYNDILARDFLQGVGCSHCKLSRLEREVELMLEEHSIKYISQQKFDWLQGLSFDFYLPEYNLAIECQGKQHFGEGGWSKDCDFTKIKERDERKKSLCVQNDVKLVYYLNAKYNHLVDDIECYNDIESLLELLCH